MNKKLTKLFLISTLLLAVLLSSACSSSKQPAPEVKNDPKPVSEAQEVILYFADEQAEYLTREKRTVTLQEDESPAEAIIKGLISGPQNKKLGVTIPSEAKLLTVNIKENIAYVDFSKEIQSKHWGGSAGESMTIFSIVNSLTELKEIKQVQILVAGEKQDSLAGHLDISQPIARDAGLIKAE
ncbi:MAG: GerMN domain-containing protein [Syntrophomonadaceae bacterium]|nr:GerMN domain-containing protein [Syntrophomonadaceae bacterium]MDD3022327.1 GerMN domain-containing protein [Syntrophomonadaceae bacterium]